MINTKCVAQDISLYMQTWRPSKATLGLSVSYSFIGVVSFAYYLVRVVSFAYSLVEVVVNFAYSLIGVILFAYYLVRVVSFVSLKISLSLTLLAAIFTFLLVVANTCAYNITNIEVNGYSDADM